MPSAFDQMPSAMQHYWSLSIEERFYVFWPILLGAVWVLAALVARRTGRDLGTVAVAVTVGVTVVASLAWSAYLTSTDPARAYFVSTTRIWELAVGGLLAAVLAVRATRGRPARPWRHGRWVRAGVAWTGLVLIAFSAYQYDGSTPFPGVAALVPTVGAALVIASAADAIRGGPGRILALRPVQWVGDISYSVYLWHWPLIIIVPFVIGRELGVVDALAVVGLTLVLSALTKKFVEDRLRWHPLLTRRLVTTFVLGGLCMAMVSGLGSGLAVAAAATRDQAAGRVEAVVKEPCVGADAVRDTTCADQGLLTPPEFAAADKPPLYADECWNNPPFTTRNVCVYGVEDPKDAKVRIAIVGNSHAGHWVPALEDTLDEAGWQLTTYVQSTCYTVDEPIQFDRAGASANCKVINQWAIDQIVAAGTDVVIMSDQTLAPLVGVPEDDQLAVAQAAYARTIAQFTDAGISVLVVRDTPVLGVIVPDCIARHPNNLAACSLDRATALRPDPLADAAATDRTGLVSVLDLSDFVCDKKTCHPVVGGVIVFFDYGHLSATFSRSVAPEMVAAVSDALAKR